MTECPRYCLAGDSRTFLAPRHGGCCWLDLFFPLGWLRRHALYGEPPPVPQNALVYSAGAHAARVAGRGQRQAVQPGKMRMTGEKTIRSARKASWNQRLSLTCRMKP